MKLVKNRNNYYCFTIFLLPISFFLHVLKNIKFIFDVITMANKIHIIVIQNIVNNEKWKKKSPTKMRY